MQVLFRAKEKKTDKYVIGYEFYNHIEDEYYITHQLTGNNYKVDKTTRSINFEDMIDSQGNKLFASLSEDGKGGDIVDTTIGLRQNFVTICLSSGVCVFTSDTSAIKNTPCKFILDYKHRGIKVVGIQKDIK